MEASKIILTNHSALKKKYKTKTNQVLSLLDKIKAADKKKGIETTIHFLDDKVFLKKLGGAAVTIPGDEKQNKAAVDKIYGSLNPDYLLLFGSSDIIPFINVRNPVFGQVDDNGDSVINSKDVEDGKFIESDLPYACNIPYTQDYNKYFEDATEVPVRAVGRLPDTLTVGDVGYITNLIDGYINWKPQKSSGAKGLVLACYDWKSITTKIAASIFKAKYDLLLLPHDKKIKFSKVLDTHQIHFINSHGLPASNIFIGQKKGEMVDSFFTEDLNGHVKSGTIAVAESCYGAQLYYDHRPGIGLPICENYLKQGAYAFLGATCSTYGESNGNANPSDADIICRNFLVNVLSGRSTGSSLLQARLDFKKNDIAKGIDRFYSYKTFLQFYLLGDPSIHLIKKAQVKSTISPGSGNGKKSGVIPPGVSNRKKSAQKKAISISNPKAVLRSFTIRTGSLKGKINNIVDRFNMVRAPIRSNKFESLVKKNDKKKSGSVTQMFNQHVIVNKKIIELNKKKLTSYKILFITEQNGIVKKIKCLESKHY